MLWLMREIMPLVWRRDPDIECLIVGHGWPTAMFDKVDPRLRLVGPVENLSDIMDKVRLTVAPLRFGAGVKGKVLESFAAGIPCVMSPIAAEGIPLSPALRDLVGDDAAAIARLIGRYHADEAANRSAARAGRAMIGRSFNLAETQAALRKALALKADIAPIEAPARQKKTA